MKGLSGGASPKSSTSIVSDPSNMGIRSCRSNRRGA